MNITTKKFIVEVAQLADDASCIDEDMIYDAVEERMNTNNFILYVEQIKDDESAVVKNKKKN